MSETFTPSERGRGFRADRALVRLGELVVKRAVEPALGGRQIWDGGLGEVVEQAVAESGIRTEPITALDIARVCGILKPRGRR